MKRAVAVKAIAFLYGLIHLYVVYYQYINSDTKL